MLIRIGKEFKSYHKKLIDETHFIYYIMFIARERPSKRRRETSSNVATSINARDTKCLGNVDNFRIETP